MVKMLFAEYATQSEERVGTELVVRGRGEIFQAAPSSRRVSLRHDITIKARAVTWSDYLDQEYQVEKQVLANAKVMLRASEPRIVSHQACAL